MTPADMNESLRELLPRLRRFAQWLTRDASSAEDLVQATLARVLSRGQREDGGLMAVYGAGSGYNVAMLSRSDAHDVRVAREALDSSI